MTAAAKRQHDKAIIKVEPPINAADAAAGVSIIDLLLPLSDLTPYERNARKHPQSQLDELAKRYREFGFTNPIIVDENCMILSGHGRAEAARIAGLEAVPCRQIIGMSEDKKRAYIIWDNKSALDSVWDEDILIDELTDLRDLGVLDATGFDDAELQALEKGWEPNWEKVDRKLEAAERGKIIVTCRIADADSLLELLRKAVADSNAFADVEIDAK